jgi:flavin-dependent dehydrogenase
MGVRQDDADVIVVGGGPAGSATAIACAARGLRVVLCEREPFVRERPGETLHPGIEPLLAQLGVADRMSEVVGARHAGIWIEWGGSRRFGPFGSDESGPWTGFQVWRADFDALLLRRARELGVEVRQPCAVTGTFDGTGGLAGVTTAEGPVPAHIVVDATGRARWLGRALGIASRSRSPRFFARYGYAKGACPARDQAPLLIGDASGWTWTAMVRPDTYQWTRLALDGSQPARDWMPDEFCNLTPLGRSRGADVTWRMADTVARPGWFMVGDAAGILDPTSSHGVLRAIVSGMTAGHLIAAVLHNAAPAGTAAIAYQDWFAAWFNADAVRLSQFYRDLNVAGFA